MLPKLADMHCHTHYCGHAKGDMKAYAEAAIEQGLSVLAFTGHGPYPPWFSGDLNDAVIPYHRFDDYWNDTCRLSEMYAGRLELRCGVEIDYLPEHVAWSRHFVGSYDFDVVLGSVHMLTGVTIDYRDAHLQPHLESFGGVEGVWQLYWERVQQLAASGLCQVMTHLDLPRKLALLQPAQRYDEQIDAILDLMLQKDLVLEINAGGIDRSADGQAYPADWILTRAVERGVMLSLGSDAHSPEQVGRYFTRLLHYLRSLGVSELYDVVKRRPVSYRLPTNV